MRQERLVEAKSYAKGFMVGPETEGELLKTCKANWPFDLS